MSQLVAHRGRSARAPENTLAAFEAALTADFEWIETDVDLLADGVPVLIHDSTLDRTTDGAGPVSAATSRSLRHRDAGSWFSADFAGERLPLLADLTDLMARTGLSANLELKLSHPTPERVERCLDAVVEELEGLAGASRSGEVGGGPGAPGPGAPAPEEGPGVVISSFDHALLAGLRERSAGAVLAPLFHAGELADGWRRAADAVGAQRIHPHHADLDPLLVETLLDAGLGISAWTVNAPERARLLSEWGVGSICTDGPEGMTPGAWEA
ncbi:hypothetical protein NBM05_10755 [Rothia sp. AR01]|uniref:GP-PDE domain-containing protein n=1 Tax=Rothia santali TaxID=2949643 RepID=A0A9X2HDV3_9MICC|nr:glycerophosphodiester phosphodiesterase family protein [Rothia santali]MCP3426465.1 hypothetical protein [Rothia santali]